MKRLANITEQTMNSREIAELTGKRHDHVVRDIDKLNESYENLNIPKVGDNYYRDNKNRQQREYHLTRIQTFDLMTGYSTELRIKVNRRWEQLEADAQNDDLTILKGIEILQGRIAEQQFALKEAAPKIEFADTVAISTTGILVREFAKLLTDEGFNIGQNRLYEWLRKYTYVNHNNEPYQWAMDMGFFEVTETIIGTGTASFPRLTTKITGKGQVYLTKKLKESDEFKLEPKLF